MKRIICLLLALMLVLPIAASAEDDELDIEETIEDSEPEAGDAAEPEWNFPLALEDMNPEYIILANKHYLLDKRR